MSNSFSEMVEGMQQGTHEWLAYRESHANASEAPAVMGQASFSPKNKRDLTLLRNGTTKKYVNKGMKRGNEREGIVRRYLEEQAREIIGLEDGDEIFPAVFHRNVDGLPMSASLDGFFMSKDGFRVGVEIKVCSKNSPYNVPEGEVCPSVMWQVVHQIVAAELDIVYIATECDGEVSLSSVVRQDCVGEQNKLLAEWLDVWPYIERGDEYPDKSKTEDKGFSALAKRWKQVDSMMRDFKMELDDLKEQMIGYADGSEEVSGEGVRLKLVAGRSTVDYSALDKDIRDSLPKKVGEPYWKITQDKDKT